LLRHKGRTRNNTYIALYRRRNPPYDRFQSLIPSGRRNSSSFPSYPKLLSARWNIAHSLSKKPSSSEALGRTCGDSRDPGATSPEKSSCSSSKGFSSSSVDVGSKRAWNLLFNRMRHGSTSDDDAEADSFSAISNSLRPCSLNCSARFWSRGADGEIGIAEAKAKRATTAMTMKERILRW